MDKEQKLKDGYAIIEIGYKFHNMLLEFHKDNDSKELEKLLREDIRFIELEKQMSKLGDELGM